MDQKHGINIDYRSIPKEELGGDLFCYKWLDNNTLAIFLIDVVGHGKSAYAAAQLIKKEFEKSIYLHQPELFITSLNQTSRTFFACWYGVYAVKEQQLTYVSAGAPPAVLLPEERLLTSHNATIGVLPDSKYEAKKQSIKRGDRLFIFSDGVYELVKEDGSMATLAEFLPEFQKSKSLDDLVQYAEKVSHGNKFHDDFMLVRIDF